MKKWLLLSFCSVFITLLSGCSPENLLNGIKHSHDQEIQDIHPDTTRDIINKKPTTIQSITKNKKRCLV